MKLIVEGIKKQFGQNEILKELNLEVISGKFLTILGVSGSGKSTLLKIITGLVMPDAGRIILDGQDITHKRPEQRGIAYVFQSPLLFPHLSVFNNIAFGLSVKKFKKADIEQRVIELLKLLKIQDLSDRYPAQISGGQQQRVAIARALASKPSLLLMDEPFSNLDPSLRIEMGELIKNLQELLDLTVIFVTHDVNESLRLSDHIALMHEGQIVQSGDVHTVYYKPKDPTVAQFMGGGNWIKGVVEDGIFYTGFGEFLAHEMAEGATSLFLRPHQITINKQIKTSMVKIEAVRRMGKEVQVDVSHEGEIITVETFKDDGFIIGEIVGIEFDFIGGQ